MGIKEMPRLARFIPKIMLAITVTACDEVYRKIACWLNDMGETQASRFSHCYIHTQSVSYPKTFTDVLMGRHVSVLQLEMICIISPQKTIDSRVPMKKISSSKWFL